MDDYNEKEVLFKDFCCKCEFEGVLETEEPCDSCLEIGAKLGSVKPEKFVERAVKAGKIKENVVEIGSESSDLDEKEQKYE